ncbi:DUF3040 domain-containing protein [Brevibacterium sp.]|uniref:DUF3040 domain-containing protein n=1 Tax=Brevibacterium sp. TaxID=1701 RepID=UPI0025BE9EBE|nr:DUF3040 domain-containing protein [Brevibacterium sp.]
MALSDHEQQLLEQLEKQLRSEDPRFASSIADAPSAGVGGGLSASRVVVGVLGVVVGIAVALGGIWAGIWPLGIVGFVIMVAGGFWALKTDPAAGSAKDGGKDDGPGGAPRTPPRGSAPAGGGFMDRMEDRWERRRRGE